MTRRALTRLEVLEAVSNEDVYRAVGGDAHIMMWRICTYNVRVDGLPSKVRQLVREGLVAEPPEGGSFFTLTEAGADALRAAT